MNTGMSDLDQYANIINYNEGEYNFIDTELINGTHCLEINNETYLNISNINILENWSISFWINVIEYSSIIQLVDINDSIQFELYYNTGFDLTGDITVPDFVNSNIKEWVNIILTYTNNNTISLYINSQFINYINNYNLSNYNLSNYNINFGFPKNGKTTHMYINDIRIYNKTLLQKDIYIINNKIIESNTTYILYNTLSIQNDNEYILKGNITTWFKFTDDILNKGLYTTLLYITNDIVPTINTHYTLTTGLNITEILYSNYYYLSKEWTISFIIDYTNVLAANAVILKIKEKNTLSSILEISKEKIKIDSLELLLSLNNNKNNYIFTYSNYKLSIYLNGNIIKYYYTNIINENMYKLEFLPNNINIYDFRTYDRILEDIEIQYLYGNEITINKSYLTNTGFSIRDNSKSYLQISDINNLNTLFGNNDIFTINYWKHINKEGYIRDTLSIKNNESNILKIKEQFINSSNLELSINIEGNIYLIVKDYNIDDWFNVSYIYNGNTIKIYLNNENVFEQDSIIISNTNYTDIYIFGNNNLESNISGYTQEDIKIYNRVLNDNELNILARNQKRSYYDDQYILNDITKKIYEDNQLYILDKTNRFILNENNKIIKYIEFKNLDIIDFEKINNAFILVTLNEIYKYEDNILELIYENIYINKIIKNSGENELYIIYNNFIKKFDIITKKIYDLYENDIEILHFDLSYDNTILYIIQQNGIYKIENINNYFISKLKSIFNENDGKYGIMDSDEITYYNYDSNIQNDKRYRYFFKIYNNLEEDTNVFMNIYDKDIEYDNININDFITLENNILYIKNILSPFNNFLNDDNNLLINGIDKFTFNIDRILKNKHYITIDDCIYEVPYIILKHLQLLRYEKVYKSYDILNQLNNSFTGYHYVTTNEKTIYKGMIVCCTGKYHNIHKLYHPEDIGNNINISQALPIVEYSKKEKDKRCFGVINYIEDTDQKIHDLGYNENFITIKKTGDNRLVVNSIGEGSIWVSDINGILENGDYITSSSISGIGMKQDENYVTNYTVAKITMDCDFNPKKIEVKKSKEKVINGIINNILDKNGNIIYNKTGIIEDEYIVNNIDNYKVAYVGCTYHSG